jgi:hypothetical protein
MKMFLREEEGNPFAGAEEEEEVIVSVEREAKRRYVERSSKIGLGTEQAKRARCRVYCVDEVGARG